MFGFLLKVALVVVVVGGAFFYVSQKDFSFPQKIAAVRQFVTHPNLSFLKQVDTSALASNVSSTLDSIITHPDRNSPVVLGVKITNDSLNALVDVINQMPPEQVAQVKEIICQSATSASPASTSAK